MSDENDIDIYGDDIGGEGDNIYEGLELGDNDNGNTQTNDQNVNDTYEDIKPVIEEEPKPESFDTVKGEEILPSAITNTPIFKSDPLPYNYKPQAALMFNELHWWTKDEDLMTAIDDLGIRIRHQDVCFSEHKVNGKSKGICYVEVPDKDAADKVKWYFDNNDFQDKRMSCQHTQIVHSNPFKTIPKENSGKNANLAYQNQMASGRGSYRPRGGARPPPPMMGMPNMNAAAAAMGMNMNPAMMQQMMGVMGVRPNMGRGQTREGPSSEDPRQAKRYRPSSNS